jgi:hypothetical protein
VASQNRREDRMQPSNVINHKMRLSAHGVRGNVFYFVAFRFARDATIFFVDQCEGARMATVISAGQKSSSKMTVICDLYNRDLITRPDIAECAL